MKNFLPSMPAFFEDSGLLLLGSRGSPLALKQAEMVKTALLTAYPALTPDRIDIRTFNTSGDKIQDRPLMDVGGKGLFTKELEEGLLSGAIHAAVHSMKDMASHLPPNLGIACLLPREDVRDMLLLPTRLKDVGSIFSSAHFKAAGSITELPLHMRIGSSSIRRRAQLLLRRPDFKMVDFRGNVHTRLRKLEEGLADATLLAAAGLKRLGLTDRAAFAIETDKMLPAPAQGAIGVEIDMRNEAVADLFAPLNHTPTAEALAAERAFLAALDGSCRTPLAALAQHLPDGRLHLKAEIIKPDGSECHMVERVGSVAEAALMGRDAGEELKRRGGKNFFVV